MNDDTHVIYAAHETQYEINYNRKETSQRRRFASSKSLKLGGVGTKY
jgi:hypothetical protein